MECTHTTEWWKNHTKCICCETLYSDEEAERLADKSDREFSQEQLNQIEKWEREADEG